MLPLLSPHYPWWFGLYKKTKMVDFQVKLEDWLQEASLFNDELVDSININDFLSNEKANSKGGEANSGVLGLEWLDEKVDFSVLDNPNGLPDRLDDTKPLMEDDTAFLLGLLDSSFNSSHFDIFTNEEIDLAKQLDVQNFITEPASSEIVETHLASPQCNTLQLNSPAFLPAQSPASPYSDISEDVLESSFSDAALQSPDASSVTSDFTTNSLGSPQVQVMVCEDVASLVTSDFTTNSLGSPQVQVMVCEDVATSSVLEPVYSIEEVSRSVRKRKFVSNGESIPKIKVIIAENGSSANTRKPKDRRERKKVQNKEAAARYRIKRRMEEKVISDEVASLESTQQKLQEKHDELQSEIKYLKSLMCEMLVKKGVMK